MALVEVRQFEGVLEPGRMKRTTARLAAAAVAVEREAPGRVTGVGR